MELDDEICLCFHVKKRKILNFIRVEKPQRASQISQCFGAGTGCGWCRTLLARYLRDAQQSGDTADDPTPQEHAVARAQYIDAGHGTPPPGAS